MGKFFDQMELDSICGMSICKGPKTPLHTFAEFNSSCTVFLYEGLLNWVYKLMKLQCIMKSEFKLDIQLVMLVYAIIILGEIGFINSHWSSEISSRIINILHGLLKLCVGPFGLPSDTTSVNDVGRVDMC